MTTDTIDLPPIEPDLLDEPAAPAPRTDIAVAAAQAVDLERLDLTSLAIAKFGDWKAAAKEAEKVATAVHDLSTATKCKETRSLRERTINAPLAEARKIEKALKGKLAGAGKAVGAELTAIEAEYQRIDAPFIAGIEAAEKKIAETAEREKARKQEREDKLATIAGWVELASGKSAADIAKGLEYARGFAIDADYWQEFETRAKAALADTIAALQELHAAQVQREQEAAELAQRRAEAEAMARAMEALQGLQQFVTAAGEVDSSAKVRALLDTLEAEQVDAERFGALLPAAIMARDGALATMRTILADREQVETAEAEREREDRDIDRINEAATDSVARGSQYIRDSIQELDDVLAPTLSPAARVQAVLSMARTRMHGLLAEAQQRDASERAAVVQAELDAKCHAAIAPQETTPPADAGGTPAAVAAVAEAAPPAAGEPEHPALEREAGPITPHTEESGSSPADAPAPGTPGIYASSGAEAAMDPPSGDEGTGAHADECAPSPALNFPPPGAHDGPLETSEHEAVEPDGPIVFAEPDPADDTADVLRAALELTKYAAAPFFGKFPNHPKTTPEWWAGLREQIEALQPRLVRALERV